MGIDKIADKFKYLLENPTSNSTSPYDTTAKVLKVDGPTVWVHIPGGVDETPVERTIDAKVGDSVKVRVSGGRAWIMGNSDSPPTDDTVAHDAYTQATYARKDAKIAYDAAESAVNDALIAREAAESAVLDANLANQAAALAVEDAQAAKTSADSAIADAAEAKEAADSAVLAASEANESAEEAKQSASDAVYYANGALTSLSVVEDVIGTLNWISEHGTYNRTTDTTIASDKIYFVNQNGVYTPVVEPKIEDISTYYELNMDSTMQNYISSHLALTNEGLWVIKDNQSYKILLSNSGMQVYDASGNIVSTFGQNVTFSSHVSQTIGSEAAKIAFDPTNGQITISGNVVFSNVDAIQHLQDQIDGRVTNWYYAVDPENNTDPDLIWTTDAEKERHIGDLYYNTDTGHCWRWLKTTEGGVTTYAWSQIEDSDAAEAKAIAEAATKATQLIYTQSATANSHIALPTDWVVAFDEPTTTSTLHWTRKRPSYKTQYPVIWVATQIKNMKDEVSILNNAAYMDDTLTIIDGGHITTGTIDTDRLNVADIIQTGGIALQEDIPTNLSEFTDDVGYALKHDALYDEQTIYICMPSGTLNVEAYPMYPSDIQTYWVTDRDEPVSGEAPDAESGQTPHWTLKPPTYQKNYPVVFQAKQSKTILGTITCTTPVKNDSQTIIDGGHIVTGVIDASKATITNIDAGIVTIGDVTRTLSDVLNLVYDVTYELSQDRKTVTATAHVYRGTEDVTDWFPPQCYTWFYRTEGASDTPLLVNDVNYGYSTSVDITSIIDYEGIIVGKFIPTEVDYYIEDGQLYIKSKSVDVDDIGSFGFSFDDNGHLLYTYDNKTVADFDVHTNYTDGHLHALNLSANYGTQWVKDITVYNPDSMADKFDAIDSGAVTRTQLIYIQQPSGTLSVPKKEDVWVAATTESVVGTPPDAIAGQTPAWTTKYPTYQSNYPVIFVARQSENLAGDITCTTPVFDDSQTIIDGGHITTGTIDSNRINTQTLAAKLISSEGMATKEYADGVVEGFVQEDEAVAVSQRIYRRSSSTNAPPLPGTASADWVTATTVANDTWTITKPPVIDVNNAAYKYLWTCEQRKMVDGSIEYTTVVRDYSSTVIDGGYIQTGLIEADRIKVNDLISNNGIIVSGDNLSSLTDDVGIQTAQDVSEAISNASVSDLSDGDDYALKTELTDKADKDDAVTSTVSVYYRKRNTDPTTPVTANIGTSNNTDDAWEYVMPVPKRDCVFYTCEQYTYADGSTDYSTIRELSSETYTSKWVSTSDSTYIDGGRLYANSVTADQIQASSLLISSMNDDVGIQTATDVLNAKDEAARKATDYIDPVDSDDIFLSPSDQTPTEQAPGNSVRINANGMEIFNGGDSVAKYGESVRIGKESDQHIELSSDAFNILSDNMLLMNIDIDGATTTSTTLTVKIKKWINSYNNRLYGIVPNSTIAVNIANALVHSFTEGTEEVYIHTLDSGDALRIHYTPDMGGWLAFSLPDRQDLSSQITATVVYTSYSPNINTTIGTRKNNQDGSKGDNSFTCGEACSAAGEYAAAFGKECSASDAGAFAVGLRSSAGAYSFAAGSNVNALGLEEGYAVAIGNHVTAFYEGQIALGRYNDYSSDRYAVFMIGNGRSDSSRSNSMTVNNTGVLALGNPGASFVLENHTLMSEVSLASDSYKTGTTTFTKDGYFPLAVAGWNASTRWFCLNRCSLTDRSDGSASVYWLVYNASSANKSGSVTVDILWAKLT